MTYGYNRYYQWTEEYGVAYVYVTNHSYKVWQWWIIPGTINEND